MPRGAVQDNVYTLTSSGGDLALRVALAGERAPALHAGAEHAVSIEINGTAFSISLTEAAELVNGISCILGAAIAP